MSSEDNGCISLTIPEGAEAGDVLTFVVNGQELEIPVPIGSQPGDVLQLQIGSNNSTTDNNEEEEDAEGNVATENSQTENDLLTKLDLGNGRLLELSSQLPKELQDAMRNDATPTSGQNDTVDDGTYALPWQSGKELSKLWDEIPFGQHMPKRIIELGSGALGLVGLSFAVSLQEKLLEANSTVLLTDVQSAMPLLNYNLEQNHHPLLLQDGLTVEAKPLQWTMDRPDGDGEVGSNEPHYDCILGSDLLYNEKFIPHLVATTRRLLHPTHGVFILAVRWRKPDLEREFFRESGLEWELIQPSSGALSCPLDWSAFGDPTNDKSNLYFHQTQISVKGSPKALADITEEESGKLLADEFEAWDRAHIQIYVGRQSKAA